MKKRLILLVSFCAICMNAYASNHSAGKNPNAEYASCNIQTMLNNPKSTQWFRSQCVRILATRLERGSLNQNEKEQLKKVLVPAFYNIMEQYAYLTGERAKEKAPHFMDLYKSLTRLADENGTYGLLRRSDGFMFLEKGKQVEGSSNQMEIVGEMPPASNFGKLTGDVLNKKVELKLAQKEEDPFWGKKRAPGELTKGLSDGKDGGIVPAFDVSHLESVFLFEQDSKLEEKDFVFDVQILNNMLKERRDFRPLLTFMAENASFNKKHINYIPPRFVRLVLAYYAESLFPAEQTKLMDYVTNPNYSKPFRFLAATVAAAYAYNDDYKDFYEGKFSYYPQEAVAIIEALRTGKTGNPAESVRLEFLGKRVFPYVKGQLLLPVEKNKKTEWLEKAALGRALDKTISSAEFISVASASAPETLLTAGGILVIGGAVYGAVYTVSDALSPMYRAQFHDLLDRLTSVEVPEKYVAAIPAENRDDYEVVNGKVLIPTTDAAAQTRQAKSVLEEIFGNVELDEDGELMRMAPVIWDKFTMARVGTSATKLEAEKKKEPSCHYDDKVSKNIHIPLYLIGNLLNPGDKTTRLRARQLHSCLAKNKYCPPLTPGQEEGAVSSWFLECKNTHLNRVKVSAECRADAQELNRIFKQLTSFKDNKGRRLYARAIYYQGKWVVEAEMSVFTQTPLADMLASWVQDAIFKNGKLRITNGPENIGTNYVYRNGGHEQKTRYHFLKETQELRKNGPLQHFHYEEVKPYTYTYNKQTYRGIFKCNHSIVYQPK